MRKLDETRYNTRLDTVQMALEQYATHNTKQAKVEKAKQAKANKSKQVMNEWFLEGTTHVKQGHS